MFRTLIRILAGTMWVCCQCNTQNKGATKCANCGHQKCGSCINR